MLGRFRLRYGGRSLFPIDSLASMLDGMLDTTAPSGQTGNPTTTDLTDLNRRLREEVSIYKTAAGVATALVGVSVVALVVQRFLLKQDIATASLSCLARSQAQPGYGYGPQYGQYPAFQPGYYGQR